MKIFVNLNKTNVMDTKRKHQYMESAALKTAVAKAVEDSTQRTKVIIKRSAGESSTVNKRVIITKR